mmetsp:Transcript_47538/g.100991  ORF Transcript_47538/g.100991 Transcript_47538/m.100991 type:complete len:81 (-) Transcript_47538:345-587(-)
MCGKDILHYFLSVFYVFTLSLLSSTQSHSPFIDLTILVTQPEVIDFCRIEQHHQEGTRRRKYSSFFTSPPRRHPFRFCPS